ncbi:MAG: HlyC/CorC family transporter [Deltaproteobacteria bacterium]|nr:HlyC/CorC family transporter [Deltaproteobacteria bacterium]
MVLNLLIAAFCVLANGFFVAAEFGLVKVRISQLMTRSRKGDLRAHATLHIVQRLDSYLSVTQLGVTLSSLALGWVGEPAVAKLFELGLVSLGFMADEPQGSHPWLHGVAFTTAFIAITTFHIVVGEQAPKILAIRKAEAVAMAVSRPIQLFYSVAYPFLWVLSALSRLVLKLMRVPAAQLADSELSAEEIRVIVSGGQIDPTKRELIERVISGTDRPVRSIMVPRVDMATLSLVDSPERVMNVARTTGYSRLPLIEEHDPDKVIGYIYIKDLIVGDGLPSGGIRALRRDILFVPESRKVGDTLKDFQKTRIPIAIVVDEYGGTSGLVTVEDILEEIVGEIQDELDVELPRVVKRDDGSVIVDGMLASADLASIGIEVEPIEGHDTVAGHIVSELGRLARPGDVVRIGPYDATVEDVRRRRVTRVRLTPRPASIVPPKVEPEGEEETKGEG